MKVLLLISNLGSGGAERQLVTLSRLFKEHGVNVEFLVYHEAEFYKNILEENCIKVNRIYSNSILERVYKIRKFIRRSDFNVIISFIEVNNFIASISSIGGKKWKLVTNELSSKESTFLSAKGMFYNWFQRYSDIIVCNSYNGMAMWQKYFPKYSKKLRVIYNPIILPRVTSEYIPKRNGKLNILVAASYQYLKNPIGLVKAISLMNKEERDRLEVNWYGRREVVKGDTRAYDEAIELINSYNLHETIHLNMETKDIANLMFKSDIVGLFSELEGLPNAICEGMMLGKPIIMTKVSDHKVLVDERNGFICEWDNLHSIKETLLVASNASLEKLLEMGEHSRNKAHRLFDNNKIITQWINLIQ